MRITNDLLEQYSNLLDKQKEIAEQISTIRAILATKGSTSTKDFIVVVKDIEQKRLPGKDVLIEVFGEKAINKLLVKTSYTTISVERKAA